MTLFEQAGGEVQVRKIVARFVDRMFDDGMIGFMFRRASRDRVKAKEYEFAARHLGAAVQYTGRPLSEAHAPHPINLGMFYRRLKILDETLREMNTPAHVRDHWLRVTGTLKDQILSKSGEEACAPPATAGQHEAPQGDAAAVVEPPAGSGETAGTERKGT